MEYGRTQITLLTQLWTTQLHR